MQISRKLTILLLLTQEKNGTLRPNYDPLRERGLSSQMVPYFLCWTQPKSSPWQLDLQHVQTRPSFIRNNQRKRDMI